MQPLFHVAYEPLNPLWFDIVNDTADLNLSGIFKKSFKGHRSQLFCIFELAGFIKKCLHKNCNVAWQEFNWLWHWAIFYWCFIFITVVISFCRNCQMVALSLLYFVYFQFKFHSLHFFFHLLFIHLSASSFFLFLPRLFFPFTCCSTIYLR